jgi:hypothetical protein
LTISRQGPLRQVDGRMNSDANNAGESRVSDKVYRLCTSKESISSLIAENPSSSPGNAWNKLYGHESKSHANGITKGEASSSAQSNNERAAACGKWGPTKPSDLFLTVNPAIASNLGRD